MTEKDIFEQLFDAAGSSKDPRGVVTCCLVRDESVIATAVSSDDGLRHAEDILFEAATKGGLALGKDVVLYATLEPCSKRSIKGTPDCVTQIIGAGIGSVVFGARDPKQSDETNRRLTETGVSIRQINDLAIVKRCADIFNESVTPEHREVDVTLKPGD